LFIDRRVSNPDVVKGSNIAPDKKSVDQLLPKILCMPWVFLLGSQNLE